MARPQGNSGNMDNTGETSHPFQRISHSLVEMALIAGVLVRVLHMLFNAHGAELDWHSLVGTVFVVPVVLLAFAAVYLANYPVGQWLWRAPVFALVEVVVEAFTSLALVAAGRERWGTGRAAVGDWPSIASRILAWRFTMVCLFALVLGAIVQWVRRREFAAERKHHHHPPGPPDGTPERRQ